MLPPKHRRTRSRHPSLSKRRKRLSWNVTSLEQRLLLAADAGVAFDGPIATDQAAEVGPENVANSSQQDAAITEAVNGIVFIDSDVTDADMLSQASDAAEVVLLDADRDAITQITETLSRRKNVASIHIVSHGQAGQMKLSGKIIDSNVVDARGADLAKWSFALSPDADILLYGCEVGAGSSGSMLLQSLSDLTGADVAASIDVSGSKITGANWELEKSIGRIEAGLAFEITVLNRYQDTLAVGDEFQYTGFSDSDPISLNGNASFTGGKLELTSDGLYQAGSAFSNSSIAIDSSTSFQTSFAFEMNGGMGQRGADGLTFLLQNSSTGLNALGDIGGLLGYDGIANSVAIELDTWRNPWDQFGDEIAVSVNGDSLGQIAAAPSPINLNSGAVNYAWIDYNGETNQLSVYVSDVNARPGAASLTTNIDLSAYLGDEAFVGFTAGNYEVPNAHRILSWSMNTDDPSDPNTDPGTFAIDNSQVTVDEDAGEAVVGIVRTSDASEAASIRYETTNQSAVAGSDYSQRSGVVNFSQGQTYAEVAIPILNDSVEEDTETFRVTLSNPVNADLLNANIATVTIRDNDTQAIEGDIQFASFSSSDPINLNGNAAIAGGKLQLTSDDAYQAGSAFLNSPIEVDSRSSFQTSFAFEMNGGAGQGGADGLTFLLQSSPSGPNALGAIGGLLGYDGITNSVTIEFDTWNNPWDQFGDEIAVSVNGNSQNQIAAAPAPINLNSGAVNFAWIDYDGETNRLSVYVSAINAKPGAPTLTTNVDLSAFLGDQAYVGFSAGNYALPNAHRILSWTMNTQPGVPNNTPGTFNLESSQVTVNENAGEVVLRVLRTGDVSAPASIYYQTANQSAVTGSDYSQRSDTVNFAAGQTVAEISIPIINDNADEGDETFRVTLSNAVGANLGSTETTIVTIRDDDDTSPPQTGSPDFGSFATNDPINVNGNASINGGKLELTSTGTYQAGSAYFDSPMFFGSDTSFTTNFAFEMAGGPGAGGADGLTFILQSSPSGASALGQIGGALGYGGITNSVAIELDTWNNGWDQFGDEIAVAVNGDFGGQVASSPSPINLNSGAVNYAWIDYDGESNRLSVYVAATNSKPGAAALTTNIDLSAFVGNQVYAGFTAGNYALPNAHRILSWSMETDDPTSGPATFRLESIQKTFSETAGEAVITILRTGDATGAASINYQTYDQTAVDGDDYSRRSGLVSFNDGQREAQVVIPILDDGLEEGVESFSITIDNPVNAELGAPRTTTITILDDEQALPNFPSFVGTDLIDTNGGASVTGGKLQIISDAPFQAGSAFYTTPIDVTSTSSFQTSFDFEMNGGSGTGGADGLAFVLQNSAAGTGAIGQNAFGMGYVGIGNSVAIELDTWRNDGDKYKDEIAVVTDGVFQNHVAQARSPINLNGGGVYHAWVDYNGESNVLAVYISEANDKPTLATLKTTIELDKIVGNQMFVGFTAGSWDQPNAHRISSWWMDTEAPALDPPVLPSGELRTEIVQRGLIAPTAIAWSADGRNTYVAEKGGVVKVIRDGQLISSPVIDISAIVNNFSDRGLLDVAINPDLDSDPYMYVLYTYDPPEVWNYVGNEYAGPDQRGNRAGRLVRYTLDSATDYTTVVQGSEYIMLGTASIWQNFNGFTNSVVVISEPAAGQYPDGSYMRDFINSDSTTHTIASLEFAPDGNLLVSIGDGGSYNQMDPRVVRVQDIDSLSGKVLRIDPITGQGVSDNPFFSGDADANRSKVYQLGLRNPFRIAVDDVTGRLFIGDVGWTRWEEINTADAGANFGWPYFEGGQGVNIVTPSGYINLPAGQEFLSSGAEATPAIIALSHTADGIDAIIMGDVIRGGNLGLLYEGDILFNSLGQGIVRRASVNADGQVTDVQTFATGANYVVDIRQGPDGEMYFVDLADGQIGRWSVV
ncbi:Soluble aldose sugar dehydrogenase YliI precursor [Planctomycetes bacterium CA13]|uniref:Soluble aldose sugar dehydrogenase YliI n=1 Tax=Novipirellula herctigrandis TaxID=2527986 RepID=A0A5C5YP12_9BACT|nr:Soluble aldose sugar dehydrogenase YliI precursor [Planctomycetes bacterium CA13]